SLGGQRRNRNTGVAGAIAVGVVLLVLPYFLSHITLPYAQIMIADTIVFVSIVGVTGFSGHITLGQAAFAGFGAFTATRVVQSLHWPVIVAMFVGGGFAVVLGILTALPAVKRRGLFLGLTTLAMGLLVNQFVFQSDIFTGGGGLASPRPSIFGWSLSGDKAFYWFELVCLGLVVLLARNLKSGRLGRILAAMRDSETAARSVGIDLPTYKLFIFAASAFIAGIGGSLLAQQRLVFGRFDFDPFTSLRWFTVVIVAGVGSIGGAVIAGFLFVMLDRFVNVHGLSDV